MRKAMNDLKFTLLLIAMSIASAFLRFKSFTQFFADAVLGFCLGYSCFLLLGFWVADGAVRSGFVGIIILEARPLYDWLEGFIKNKLTDLIERKTK